jgi:hypothetical protein
MLDSKLRHTCSISRNGAVVSTLNRCLFQEGMRMTRTGSILGGMLDEATPKVDYTIIFGVEADVRVHDGITAIVFPGETADTRRFAVQTVTVACRPQGTRMFITAWVKLA